MAKYVRIVLAVVVGVMAGSVANMTLVLVGSMVIPAPAGADVTTVEGLRASLHLLEPRHFLFPFLAHSVSTLLGSLIASLLAPSSTTVVSYAVGILFLAGGIANSFMVPAPAWYIAVDVLFAYLPAAWIGRRLAVRTLRKINAGVV